MPPITHSCFTIGKAEVVSRLRIDPLMWRLAIYGAHRFQNKPKVRLADVEFEVPASRSMPRSAFDNDKTSGKIGRTTCAPLNSLPVSA